MPDDHHAVSTPDPLDRLTEALLEVGGLLSQIVAGMSQWQASGRSGPDLVPIPEAAHDIVRGVIDGLASRHSKRDLRMAARVVNEASAVIASDVFAIDPAWFDSITQDGGESAHA